MQRRAVVRVVLSWARFCVGQRGFFSQSLEKGLLRLVKLGKGHQPLPSIALPHCLGSICEGNVLPPYARKVASILHETDVIHHLSEIGNTMFGSFDECKSSAFTRAWLLHTLPFDAKIVHETLLQHLVHLLLLGKTVIHSESSR